MKSDKIKNFVQENYNMRCDKFVENCLKIVDKMSKTAS